MAGKKKPIAPKIVRRQENSVTHVLEETILDRPQLAMERTRRAIDSVALQYDTATFTGPYAALADAVDEYLTELEAERAEPRAEMPFRVMHREYTNLLASEQTKYTWLLQGVINGMKRSSLRGIATVIIPDRLVATESNP